MARESLEAASALADEVDDKEARSWDRSDAARCFEPMRKDDSVTISQMRCKGHEEGSFIKKYGKL
jgi:hypothetical protein